MAQLAPQQVIASLRRPKTIFTEDYLNDPIRFDPDQRFEPETALRQLNEIVIVNRDNAGYAMVDINKNYAQWYPVTMYSPAYARADVEQFIDTQFKQLI